MSHIKGIYSDFTKRLVETPENKDLFLPPSATNFPNIFTDDATPLPIVSIGPNDVAHNFMFDSDGQCPDLVKKINENISSNQETYREFIQNFYDFLELNNYSAIKFSETGFWNLKTCSHFIDTLVAYFWVQDIIPSYNLLAHSIFFNTFFISMRFSDSKLCGYLNTPMLLEWKKIILKLKTEVENKTNQFELKLFSAHDTNLINYLSINPL